MHIIHRTEGGQFSLETVEWPRGTRGLVSPVESIARAGLLWSRIDYAAGSFWVVTDWLTVTRIKRQARLLGRSITRAAYIGAQ